MKLAFDENLPPSLARTAHALLQPEDGQAISIPERFGRGFADVDWISALHEEGGWAVLTTDRKLQAGRMNGWPWSDPDWWRSSWRQDGIKKDIGKRRPASFDGCRV